MNPEDFDEIICGACGHIVKELHGDLCMKCAEEKKREGIHNDEDIITTSDSQSDISERAHRVKSSTGTIPSSTEAQDE